jgi:hypothetical protein
MKSVRSISIHILLILFASCGSSHTDLKGSGSAARYRVIAAEKYGKGVEYLFNEKNTAVLCLKSSKPSAENPLPQVSFFVFDLSIDSTIFEDAIANGSVSWRDSFTVVVNTVPGTVKSDDSSPRKTSGYIFDCRSRKTKSLDASSVE